MAKLKKIPLTGRRSGVLEINSKSHEYFSELFKGTVLIIEDSSDKEINSYKATGYSKHISGVNDIDDVENSINMIYHVLQTRIEETNKDPDFYKNDKGFLNYNLTIQFDRDVFNDFKPYLLQQVRDIALHGSQHGISLVLVVNTSDDSIRMSANGNKMSMSINIDNKDNQYVWQEVFLTTNEIIQLRKDGVIVTNIGLDAYGKESKIALPKTIDTNSNKDEYRVEFYLFPEYLTTSA